MFKSTGLIYILFRRNLCWMNFQMLVRPSSLWFYLSNLTFWPFFHLQPSITFCISSSYGSCILNVGLVEVNKHNYYYSDRQRQVVRYIIAISCHYPPPSSCLHSYPILFPPTLPDQLILYPGRICWVSFLFIYLWSMDWVCLCRS